MITPIRTMTISEIAKRKADLLVSADDIKEMAKNERNKAIDEMQDNLIRNSRTGVIDGGICLIVTDERIKQIAKQMKEGV